MTVVIQSLSTVTLFVAFVALWIWAWRKERGSDYAAAAVLPLEDHAGTDQSQP